ncbi:uncharacterized protein LY79DRAFT_343984 [Colletotrichum navitas]|uniref:Uncharacterized protein n=1 Tax=Colletotrichum navitas TaxID=681940 RepID=A0AAD8PRP7_9PEZI|nr:uncharacterized protein LY79DRAFT_343984 [Colletotrichum navitas]KAK1579498.1 hypothetical protein LY79DRAFT_343984 [Colletotrichum navitas]
MSTKPPGVLNPLPNLLRILRAKWSNEREYAYVYRVTWTQGAELENNGSVQGGRGAKPHMARPPPGSRDLGFPLVQRSRIASPPPYQEIIGDSPTGWQNAPRCPWSR